MLFRSIRFDAQSLRSSDIESETTRWLNCYNAGVMTLEEVRQRLGLKSEPEEGEYLKGFNDQPTDQPKTQEDLLNKKPTGDEPNEPN